VRITSSTQLYGIIGHPVHHSLSPAMQNAAFQEVGIDAVYLAFDVEPGRLAEAMAGARSLGVRGMNVTIPHKESVMRLLDELGGDSAEIGAVNTVVNKGGTLVGYNTDGIGARRALADAGVDIAGKVVLLLGAGGAARAIAFTLSKATKRIIIANRAADRAVELASRLRGKADAGGLDSGFLRKAAAEADIMINCTSVGMSPNSDEAVIDRGYIRKGQVVFDIVYTPIKTKLLREAEAAGAVAVDGVGMLVNQGAESFTLWTGREAPGDVMRRAVLRQLMEGSP